MECLADDGWDDALVMPRLDIAQLRKMLRGAKWEWRGDESMAVVMKEVCQNVKAAATFLFSLDGPDHAYDFLAKGRYGKGRGLDGMHAKYPASGAFVLPVTD